MTVKTTEGRGRFGRKREKWRDCNNITAARVQKAWQEFHAFDQTHLASISRVYEYLLSKQWFYTFWAFLQIKSPNKHMHNWNIFLIEALSMLASPWIKTVKPPDKKPGTCSDRSSFLHRHTVKFQFVWQKLCYHISLAGLLQMHVGLLDSSAKYQKFFVCLRKTSLMVVLWKGMETTTCHRLISVGNLN